MNNAIEDIAYDNGQLLAVGHITYLICYYGINLACSISFKISLWILETMTLISSFRIVFEVNMAFLGADWRWCLRTSSLSAWKQTSSIKFPWSSGSLSPSLVYTISSSRWSQRANPCFPHNITTRSSDFITSLLFSMVFWSCALGWVAIVCDGFSYGLTNLLILVRELAWYSDPEWKIITWVFLAQVLDALCTNWPGDWPLTSSGPKNAHAQQKTPSACLL